MTAYSEWLPGPTNATQFESLSECLDAFYGIAALERTGVIGGSSSLTWYLAGVSVSSSPNPSMNVLWTATTGGHTATTFCRYNAALLGTLDPSWAFLTEDFCGNWVRSFSRSDWETYRVRVGSAANAQSAVSQMLTTWMSSLTGGGSLAASSATAILYTDGSHANQIAGFRLVFGYDPSVGDLSAGILQCIGASLAMAGSSADGTINSGISGASLGTSVQQVPVPIAASPDAQESWDSWLGVQPLDKRNVSHIGDLGGATPKSSEPSPGEAVPIFEEPDQVAEVADDPSVWDLMTTVPSWIAGFFIAAGKLAASIAAAGLVSLLAAAATAIGAISVAIEALQLAVESTQLLLEESIAVDIDTIASRSAQAADGIDEGVDKLDAIKVEVEGVKDAITALEVDVDVGPITTAIETMDSNHPGGLVAEVENLGENVSASSLAIAAQVGELNGTLDTISTQLNPATAGTFASRLVNALESIADSLAASPGATPPAKKLTEQLADMQSSLDDVANLQQTLDVQAHGVRFKASTGWDEP